jgi:hypothetical protein
MRWLLLFCILSSLFVLGCREEAAPPNPSQGGELRQVEADRPRSADGTAADRPASHPSDGAEDDVQLDAITLTAPAGWERKPTSSPFVIAELALPRIEGDEADGRLTISTAGGSVEANIDRWKGQFEPQPESASQEDVDVGGLKVTIVDLSGTFNDQRGPFAPGERRPGYRMIAAVIPVEGQLHFIKATGPQNTIASHADAIHQFIRSARPTN